MSMTRQDLISSIARNTGLTKKDVTTVLLVQHQVISHYLNAGGEVNILGFGKFGVRKQSARFGRNPRTGAAIKIKAKRVPFFKPGKALRQAVN